MAVVLNGATAICSIKDIADKYEKIIFVYMI